MWPSSGGVLAIMPELCESEKAWMRDRMREYGPRAAKAADDDLDVALCAAGVLRFIRLTEQLLRLHDDYCERRRMEWLVKL